MSNLCTLVLLFQACRHREGVERDRIQKQQQQQQQQPAESTPAPTEEDKDRVPLQIVPGSEHRKVIRQLDKAIREKEEARRKAEQERLLALSQVCLLS